MHPHFERLSPPKLERRQWHEHPNYPGQVLLLRSHESFRSFTKGLIEAAADERRKPMHVSYAFEQLIGAMGGHEHYEEHKLYRYLEWRYDVSLDSLRNGHERLHACHDRVRDGFRTAIAEDDRGPAIAALSEFAAVLDEHLDEEEDVVIPMLLELSPREFASYSMSSIHELISS